MRQSVIDVMVYVPAGTSEADARTWAYLQVEKQWGEGETLPPGASVASGIVTIKPRPAEAADDWPAGCDLVLAAAVVSWVP